MNNVLSLISLVRFAALPLAVLGLRAARPRQMPWWAVFSIVIGLGWMLVLVSAMVNETTEGGAGHVFALFFGWAFALVWLAPWLFAYALFQLVRDRAGRRALRAQDDQ